MSQQVHIYLHSLDGGGAERVFVRLANYYANAGLRTRLCVNTATGPLQTIVSSKVDLIDFGKNRARETCVSLKRYLEKERPSALLCALTVNNLTALTARAGARVSTRLVISERNNLSSNLKRWPLHKQLAIRLGVRALYTKADAITAVSSGVADDLSQISGVNRGKISVIYNPPPDRDEIAAAKASPNPHPWLAEDIPVIIAMGRLVPQKGYHTLIDAFAILRANRSARLVILGDGPLLPELISQAESAGIRNDICFQGFVMNRLDYLVRSSIYVLSSDREGFPNALLEALACGIPVVSTDCDGNGPREILGRSLPETLVPVGDAVKLAAAISEQISSPPLREALDAIATPLTMDHAAGRYLALLEGAATA
jgi:glycosyltransferase involved in cell wall biosynthesis